MDVPALSCPSSPILAGVDGEPVGVCAFVELDVFDKSLQLLSAYGAVDTQEHT